MPSTSNAPKNEGFKGKCNYCHKFGHKKTNYRKLKAVQEKKVMISINPISQEWYVFMGNDTRVQVVSLGIVRLHLNIEFFFSFFAKWGIHTLY